MAVTRIKNNQITDASPGNTEVGINANTKIQNYSITSQKLANNLTYGSDLVISGNLTVQGTTTAIDSTYTTIEDPVILLASMQTGAPVVDIGFIGDRGDSPNIAFVWNEANNEFVTAFTSTGETNTVVSISSYANFHTGNANIGNLSVSGNITGAANFTGNITASNLFTPGDISATGAITGGNVSTAGFVSATGTVTGGNIATTGTVSATGNITGNYFIGNGALLTGIDTTLISNGNSNVQVYANGNVATSVAGTANVMVVTATGVETTGTVSATGTVTGGNIATAGTVSATGNITGNYFIGNGSQLTGVTADSVNAANLTGNTLSSNVIFSSLTSVGNLTTLSVVGTTTTGNLETAGTVSATGTITGGNIATAGSVTATGDVTGGNLYTSGTTSAGGNVIGGNVLTSGIVSATSTIQGGNILTAGEVSATGSLTGGNIFTGGQISAVSDVTGGNLVTAGQVTATGTVTGGNIATAGFVTATGDVTGGNLVTAGSVTATGNVTGGNVTTAGLLSGGNITTGGTVSATGNITGGNIATAGAITATGNITGNYFFGNGSQLTGIDTNLIKNGNSNVRILTTDGNISMDVNGVSNVVVVTATGIDVTGTVSAVGNVQGANIFTTGNVSATGNLIGGNVNTSTIWSSGDLDLAPTGNIVLDGGKYINNVNNPVQAQDAATKQYVDDAVSAGIHIHTPVYLEANSAIGGTYAQGGNTATVTDTVAGNTVVFSTAVNLQPNDQLWFANSFEGIQANTAYFVVSAPNTSAAVLSLSYSGAPVTTITSNTGLTQSVRINSGVGATLTNNGANATLVIDGVTVSNGERVLIYSEANAVHNGVYVVSEAGNATTAWQLTRSSDTNMYVPDDNTGLDQGSYFFVQAGNSGAGESYVMTNPAGPFIIGYDNIEFTQFSASGVYSANTNAGLSLTGTVFSAKVDNNTTAFDLNGNIIVKAGANLTTPNIGAATGTSLSLTGNVTAGNVLFDGGIVSGTGNIYSGNTVTTNAYAGNLDVSGTSIVNSLTANTTVSASGTVTAGNIATSGTVSATGNVTGGNILTAGLISATGTIESANTITGGNIATAGTVSATGTVTGGNIATAGSVTATGDVTGGNVYTTGVVSATGTGTFGNVATAGTVSATGTIQGGNVLTAGEVSAGGSLTGGNIFTGGLISAVSTITGGNLATTGTVTATGTVTGGNVVTAGYVSATGNVTGGNILFGSGIVSGTGDIYAGNIFANITGNVDAAGNNTEVQFNDNGILGASSGFTFNTTGNVLTANGNINGSNFLTTGIVSATGNITGNYFIGNGSQLTGIDATSIQNGNSNVQVYANGNVATSVAGTANVMVVTATGVDVTGTVSATGNISGNYFFGNGSQLTGIDATSIQNGNSNVQVYANGNVAISITGTSNTVVFTTTGVDVTGTVSASGNITGANIFTSGSVSATGNANFGNIQIGPDSINNTGTDQTITINNALGNTNFAVNGTGSNVFFVDASTNTASFGSSAQTTNALVAFNSTNSIKIPVGNTVQKPSVGVTGMMRFNTSLNKIEIYDNSQWSTVGDTQFTVIDDQQFNGDGNTVAFTLNSTQTTNSCIVSINGVVQIPTIAYSVSGVDPSCVLTFTEAPAAGDLIDVRQITTTTTVIGISNTSGNAAVSVTDANNIVTVTGDLSVTGNVNISGNVATNQINNGNSAVQIPTAGGNVNIDVGAVDNMAVFTSTTLFITGNISATGDIVGQNVNSLSDETLKANVVLINNAGQVIDSLSGVGYDWKDGSGHAYGMIAQKVEEVLPEAVKTDANGIKSVNYNMVIPFLVEAVKELRKDIAEIKSQLKK